MSFSWKNHRAPRTHKTNIFNKSVNVSLCVLISQARPHISHTNQPVLTRTHTITHIWPIGSVLVVIVTGGWRGWSQVSVGQALSITSCQHLYPWQPSRSVPRNSVSATASNHCSFNELYYLSLPHSHMLTLFCWISLMYYCMINVMYMSMKM